MNVVAKFRCMSHSVSAESHTLKFKAVDRDSKENETFFKYTPLGNIELNVVSSNVAGQFIPGNEYFVSFSESINNEVQ